MRFPEWALKHKTKGTEIREISGHYYLYKVTSKWDKIEKKPKKITEGYLGKITPEGLIKPKKEQIMESLKNINVKEFGATDFLRKINTEIEERLKKIFLEDWKEILNFALFRLIHNAPIKNLQTHYHQSFLSESIKGAKLSPKYISELLRRIGMNSEKTKAFMRQFIAGNEYILIDLTHVLSLSKTVISAVLGFNSKREFFPQVHLILLFSLDKHMPIYFRIVPGSIRDVSSFVLTVKEAGVKNAVLIGDKGFYSEGNVLELKTEDLHFILPLKRNSSLIDYSKIAVGDKKHFDGYFPFEKRIIWHYSYKVKDGALKDRKILVFLDPRLKAEEEKDYINRIGDGKRTLESFYTHQHRQGTISVITDLDVDGEKIFHYLKGRAEIEVVFDVFKNILHADRSYVRDDYQLEGWMFVNFIALLYYYKIYRLLCDYDLLKKYSPKDVLLHLSRIKKLQILNEWLTSEIPKKSRVITEKLKIAIP